MKIILRLSLILFAAVAVSSQQVDYNMRLFRPYAIAIDNNDNIYSSGSGGLYRVFPDGSVKRISEELSGMIKFDSKGRLYIAKGNSAVIRVIDPNKPVNASLYAGVLTRGVYEDTGHVDGPRNTALFKQIRDFTFDKNDNMYVLDWAPLSFDDNRNLTTGKLKLYEHPKLMKRMFLDSAYYTVIRKIDARTGKVTTLTTKDGSMVVFHTDHFTVDDDGNIIYAPNAGRAIMKYNVTTEEFSVIAGKPYEKDWCPTYKTGDVSIAELFDPAEFLMVKSGAIVYTDRRSNRISMIYNGKVSTVAGGNIIQECGANIGGRSKGGYKDGPALQALFGNPKGFAFDSKNTMYIADYGANCIRKLTTDHNVSSLTSCKWNPNDQ